nr:MAG TPA: hypothetical protein [Caudoviricetes sp.]
MANLRKIRIGTDITIALSVNVSGQPVTWKDGDIRHVYAFSDVQGQPVAEMAHKADGKTLRCTYAAKDQNYTGAFRVIVEFASGEAFSSSLDVPAFEIVRTTEEADADNGEVVLDIDGTMRFYSLSEAIAKIKAATKAATDAAAAADKSAGNADAKAKAANDAAEKANAAAQAAGTTNTGIAKAEEQRVNAENARKEAELARSKAEAARASAEDKRAESEAKRAKAEAQRAAGEQSRATAETGRVNAESARVKAESARDNAEGTRAANEELRKNNEKARTSAEAVRAETEKRRVAAESARVAEFARLKTESETATKNATDAAEEAKEVSSGVAALERDLGQYAELPSVAMAAETTGKYINAEGEFVDDADFNIAAIGAVVVGNTYELYMGSAAKMKLGVALFVARIKTTTTSGTERIEYVPLFSAMSTDIPTSGYVCFEAMEAYSDVLVCYRADVPEAATLRVRRYGTKASIATQINNLRKKVDLKSFADGYYESMRVGTADNLTSKGDATEEVIMSRKAGGDNQIEDGSASIKRIKGYSVVMNNKIIIPSRVNNNGVTIQTNSDGSFNINGTALDLIYVSIKRYSVQNHLYLGCLENGIVEDNKFILYNDTDNGLIFGPQPSILKSKKDSLFYILIKPGMSFDNLKCHAYSYDLTQMFGSGNEPTTPDDFAKRLGYSSIDDVPYIPYNEGEIVSSFAEGIKTTGKNLWDENYSVGDLNNSTGEEIASDLTIRSSYVPILSENKIYLFNGSKTTDISFDKVLFYNADKTYNGVKQYVNSGELELPKGTSYIRFVLRPSYGTTYNHDVCINVSDVSFNGNYEPYTERLRKWSETLKKYFPDGLKSAGSVYDEIAPTKAVKRIEMIPIVNLTWTSKTTAAGVNYYECSRKCTSNAIVTGYNRDTGDNIYYGKVTNAYGVLTEYNALLVSDANYVDDLQGFLKNAKEKGLVLQDSLSTPEEYIYDELNLTEQVSEGGTEEAIITEGKTSTPLRADIVYPIDAYNTIKANKTNIGTLSSLNTASKTDLVSAINELVGKVASLEAKATEVVTNETTE